MDEYKDHIVVGFDGSDESSTALDWATETAVREGRELTIVHTLDLSSVPQFRAFDPLVGTTLGYDDVSESFLDAARKRATSILPDDRVTTLGSIGSPAGALIEASEVATVVVVGSRGRGRLASGLLGSTSYSVTAHATCPVVVVRAAQREDGHLVHPSPEHRVIVGVDDSEPASRAVREAARIADQAKATLHIVSVAHAPSLEAWAYAETAQAGTDHQHDVHAMAEEKLELARVSLVAEHPDLQIETEVLYGDPGQTMADLAVDAGLVVVGSRGRGGFTGMLLGSVSHALIHRAPCPVMIVR